MGEERASFIAVGNLSLAVDIPSLLLSDMAFIGRLTAARMKQTSSSSRIYVHVCEIEISLSFYTNMIHLHM